MNHRFLKLLGVLLTLVSACSRPAEKESVPDLSSLIQSLSEPGGFFDTDNIISNETSYMQVVEQLRPVGGATLVWDRNRTRISGGCDRGGLLSWMFGGRTCFSIFC